MLNPMSMELLASDMVRRNINEAAQAALIAQLPRTPSVRPDVFARHFVANRLRAIAVRLDPNLVGEPSLVCEPSLAVARPR